MDVTPEERARLRELAEKATPGPYASVPLEASYDAPGRNRLMATVRNYAQSLAQHREYGPQWDAEHLVTFDGATADYLAAANPLIVIDLLDAIEVLEQRARERGAGLRAIVDHGCGMCGSRGLAKNALREDVVTSRPTYDVPGPYVRVRVHLPDGYGVYEISIQQRIVDAIAVGCPWRLDEHSLPSVVVQRKVGNELWLTVVQS